MKSTLFVCASFAAVVICVESSVCLGDHHYEKIFDRCNRNQHGGVTLPEFLRLGKRHSGAIRRQLLKQFMEKDKSAGGAKNGTLTREEFSNRVKTTGPKIDKNGKKIKNSFVSDGDVLFPEAGLVVDVNEFDGSFEVMIMPPDPGPASNLEYLYFATTIDPGATPAATPSSGSYAINDDMGMYVTGWVDFPLPSDFYSQLHPNRRKLVIWEGSREFQSDPEMEPDDWEFTAPTSMIIYGHTANSLGP